MSLTSKLWGVVVCASASVLVAGWLRAEEPERVDPTLQDELANIVEQHELPGMIAAVIKKGRISRLAATGVRKIGEPNLITVDDKIHLGSCTKAMTATLLAILVDEQKIAWDTALPDLLPTLKNVMHEDYRDVTLRQLLTHRSGLPANSVRMFIVDKEATTATQRRELFKVLLSAEPKYPPGSEFLYSNLGYMLAGLVAEEATGETWETLMSEKLFQPLGMKSVGFGVPGTLTKVDQPWGHRKLPLLGLRSVQKDNPVVLGPAGIVHASFEDWAKFVALHLKHQHDPVIVKDETIDELHRLQPDQEYAMGWVSVHRDWADGNALTHSGSNTMWMAVVWMAPQRDLAFLVATNSGQKTASKACDQAVGYMLKHLSH